MKTPYPKDYQPRSIYIITGESNSGKSYLARQILKGYQINKPNYEHKRIDQGLSTAHIEVDNTPDQESILIDNLTPGMIDNTNIADELVELINDHQPQIIIVDGQDEKNTLAINVINQLALNKFHVYNVQIN